ncbi:hypothetical protein KTR9_3218 [Gordonia sp. KTR9]|nr:hypothetical protein KTR9_3218 [Gordonia sp. KTR9]
MDFGGLTPTGNVVRCCGDAVEMLHAPTPPGASSTSQADRPTRTDRRIHQQRQR